MLELKWRMPDPSKNNKKGKRVFARACLVDPIAILSKPVHTEMLTA
jgi:hypothetical protein